MDGRTDRRTNRIVKIEIEFWTQNSQLVQVPWGQDVLGEIARATSAKDGLGSQGGGRPGEPSCTTTSSFLKDGQFVMGFRVLLR